MASSARSSKSTQRQSALGVMTRVLRLRLKEKHAKHLLEQSREVNQVWNYCNETSQRKLQRERWFFTSYDLDKITSGASKVGLSLHSQTVQAISAEYCTRRKQFKKTKLRWRVSHGSRYSLGWIPVKANQFYRDLQPALAKAKRAGHKESTKAIHAKISNRRQDFLHKLSTRLVKEHGKVRA